MFDWGLYWHSLKIANARVVHFDYIWSLLLVESSQAILDALAKEDFPLSSKYKVPKLENRKPYIYISI